MPTEIIHKEEELAKKLGYKALIIDRDVEIINEKNMEKMRKQIQKAKKEKKVVLVEARDQKYNVNVVDKTEADMLVNLEHVENKDHTHYRRGGLNQVLAKKMKNKKICINLAKLLESKEKAKIIGRLKQNIFIARKYKVKIFLASFAKDKKDLVGVSDKESLLVILGMNHKEAKQSI